MYLHKVLDGVGVMIKLVAVLGNWLEMGPNDFVKFRAGITEKKYHALDYGISRTVCGSVDSDDKKKIADW